MSIEQIQQHLAKTGDDFGGSDAEQAIRITEAAIAATWALGGYQSVTMTHTLAAGLMATESPRTEVPLPWSCFEVRVPTGLLKVGNSEISSIIVCDEIRRDVLTFIMCWDKFESLMSLDKATSWRETDIAWEDEEGFLEDTAAIKEHTENGKDAGKRALVLAKRLAINLCFALQAHREALAASEPSDFVEKERKTKQGLTTHEFRAAAMNVNLSAVIAEVRNYIDGRRSSVPKVTTMVRGHWRRQVCGVGRALRRLTWIAPFYRGSGPMLVRNTYVFGEPPEELDERSKAQDA